MSKYTQPILQRKVIEAWSRCEPLVNKAYHDPDNFSEMDGVILEAYSHLYEIAQRRLKRYSRSRIYITVKGNVINY